jgi:hypothetical protein
MHPSQDAKICRAEARVYFVGCVTMTTPNTESHQTRFLLTALILTPWFLLAADVFLFPDFVETRIKTENFSVQDLLSSKSVELGKFHLHRVQVSIGNIGDQEYLTRLCKSSNALAIAMFPSKLPNDVGLGSFGRRVLGILSGEDQRALLAELSNLRNSPLGMLGAPVELQKRGETSPLACIDRIYVIKAEEGSSSEATQALRTGLVEMFKSIDRSSKGLIVPTLTVPPTALGTQQFGDLFHCLFDALAASKLPHNVDISFYDQWTSPVLQSATSALNTEWQQRAQDEKIAGRRFYRLDLRLFLAFLPLCFLVSARRIAMSLKTVAIISCAFAALILSSFSVLTTLADGEYGTLLFSTKVAIALVEAVFFPSIVQWGAEKLFEGNKK